MKIVKSIYKYKNEVLDCLFSGNPIILPTDTNYNLACIPTCETSIDKVFKYKHRKKDKPMSLFFLNPNDWAKYGEAKNKKIMNLLVNTFWPGPLNIVIEKKDNKYDYMLNGMNSISLGCISNPSWRNFLSLMNGSPIAITSANISGTVDGELVTEDIALQHMGNNVKYMVLSKAKIKASKSSTIVKVFSDGIKILRSGDICLEALKTVLSESGYSIYE